MHTTHVAAAIGDWNARTAVSYRMMPEMLDRALGAPVVSVVCALTLGGCGGKDTPPSPAPGGSSGDVQVSGGERLGWSQQAANASELSTFQYAIYIDGNRNVLTGATCGTIAASAGFDCSAPLPVLTAGSHAIELAAFAVDGGVLESAKSAPLRVTLRTLTLSSGVPIDPRVVTAEHVQLQLGLVAEGFSLPTDIAFLPDGSILVAERGGTVREIRDGELSAQPALDLSGDVWLPEGGLLAMTADPNFQANGFVYVLTAAKGRRGELGFTLSRYRGVGGRFGERAVLLDRILATAGGAGAALRIGPDGKIYAAFDDAGNGRAAGSLASYNGKVLRLNMDATTPDDQPGFSPIYSLDHPAPRALAWQPATGDVWVLDSLGQTSGRLTAVPAVEAKQKSGGAARVQYALPAGTGAVSAAFYRGMLMPVFRDNLFIAAEAGRHLIRLQFDPDSPERIVSTEQLLQDQIGSIRLIAVGPDEALYLANDSALFRLAP
jgi:glucose/arabinose dehydrogenase